MECSHSYVVIILSVIRRVGTKADCSSTITLSNITFSLFATFEAILYMTLHKLIGRPNSSTLSTFGILVQSECHWYSTHRLLLLTLLAPPKSLLPHIGPNGIEKSVQESHSDLVPLWETSGTKLFSPPCSQKEQVASRFITSVILVGTVSSTSSMSLTPTELYKFL